MRHIFIFALLLSPYFLFSYQVDRYISIVTNKPFTEVKSESRIRTIASQDSLGKLCISIIPNDSAKNGLQGLFYSDSFNMATFYTGFIKGWNSRTPTTGIRVRDEKIKKINGFYVMDFTFDVMNAGEMSARVYNIKHHIVLFTYSAIGDSDIALADRDSLFSAIVVTNCKPGEQYERWNLKYPLMLRLLKLLSPFIVIVVAIAYFIGRKSKNKQGKNKKQAEHSL